MNKRKVIIRADGNTEIGLGHITRSLALADMLKDRFECVLATRYLTNYIQTEAGKSCSAIVELSEENHQIDLFNYLAGDEFVVLDNYFFEYDFQRAIRERGNILFVIDDLHDKSFCADAIINHAPLIDKSVYKALPQTKYFLGLDYVLLRSQFNKHSNAKREIKSVSKAFLCFGGSDINNYTAMVYQALLSVAEIDTINIVIGSAYAYRSDLLESIKKVNTSHTNVYSGLSAGQMIDVMHNSDLAIVPSSSILFEVLKIGMPVVSGYYIENQLDIYKGFLREDVICRAGDLRLKPDWQKILTEYIRNVEIDKLLKRQKEIFKSDSKTNLLKAFQSFEYESSNIN